MAAAKKEKKPIMSCASSGHITKLKQSIFAPFDIYGVNSLLETGFSCFDHSQFEK
jgi:hypothetical protein